MFRPWLLVLALSFSSYAAENSSKISPALSIADGLTAYRQQQYAQAEQILLPLAKAGQHEAQYYLGLIYRRDESSYEQAVNWFSQAAANQDPLAQTRLGECYEWGLGTKQDYQQASQWYLKAAEQGHADAQTQLAALYQRGLGVKLDAEQAVAWYQKAADQGYAPAQFGLGYLHHRGQGVKQDETRALFWWKKAAAQGQAAAQSNLGVMYARGTGVAQDKMVAVEWYQKAAEQGDLYAQFNLANAYLDGAGLTRDLAQAYLWLSKVIEATTQAEQGHNYDMVDQFRTADLRAESLRLKRVITKQLSPEQLKEAERMVEQGGWTPPD